LADGPANISFITDITARKRAEAELRELSGRLLRLEDDERQRIARELHDTTAQELAAISMNLAVLKARAPELKAGEQAVLAETIALTDRCASEVRTMSYLLHPPALEALGLAGAGRDYIDGFARRSGIRIDLQISDDLGRFPAETERALFRVLQESLVNIHRHSGSRTASIRLTRTADQVRLEVRDAGRGMRRPADPLAAGPSAGGLGVGIPGMRERMRQLGGQLEIQSDAQGTCVIATMPVDRQTHLP
jgi:signal transduction histidine kinase